MPPAPTTTPAIETSRTTAAEDTRPTAAVARPAPTASPTASPVASPTERDFRDGLHALLAGDARDAAPALARACSAPSSVQTDACYWSAVASLRAGDRAGARRGFEDLLRRFPGATHAGEARIALGWLLLDAGDRAGAYAQFALAARDRMPSVRREALRGLAAAR